MRAWTFALVTLGSLALVGATGTTALAQVERPPVPREKVPEKLPPPPSLEDLIPGCRAVWVDYVVPVQTLYARPAPVRELVTVYEVFYRPEKRVVSDVVLEPREVTREVIVCTTEPVTTTDPVTGHCCTVQQQVTRTKLVKGTEFVAVTKTREIEVPVPELRPVTREVIHNNVLLEWKTDLVKQGCAVRIPGGEPVNTEHLLAAPRPPCEHP
jgi:hypothetical protein